MATARALRHVPPVLWRRLVRPLGAEARSQVPAVPESASVTLGGAPLPYLEAKELQTRISKDACTVEEVWDIVRAEHSHFDEGHAVTCFTRIASLGYRQPPSAPLPPALETLVRAVQGPLEAQLLLPDSIARLASAVAAISLPAPALLEGLAAEVERRADRFGAVDAALSARAFAKLRCARPVGALVEGAASRANSFGTQALVNIVWAAATVKAKDEGALGAVLDEAALRKGRLKPQGIANLVWALGSLRQRRAVALEALLPYTAHRARDFTPQGLANVLWGLAALRPPGAAVGWLEEDAVIRLAKQAMRSIGGFACQELSGLARATTTYAAAGTRGGDFLPLLDAIVSQALLKASALEPRHVGHIAWAMAKLLHSDRSDWEAFAAEAQRRIGEFGAQEVGALAWSLATAQVRHAPVMSAFAARLQSIESRERVPFGVLSGIVSTHAYLRVFDDNLLGGGLAAAATRRARRGTSHEIARLASGMVVLRCASCPLLDALAAELQRRDGVAPRDCAAAAWAFSIAGLATEELLDALSRGFLASASRPLADDDRGRDWVEIAEALRRSGIDCSAPGTPRYELLAAFRDAIFEPALRRLRELRHGQADAPALGALGRLATSLGFTTLGTVYSQDALSDAGLATVVQDSFAETADWVARARHLVQEHRRADLPPHKQDLAAWVAYDVSVQLSGLEEMVQEAGRVVAFRRGEQAPGELLSLALTKSDWRFAEQVRYAEQVALRDLLQSVRMAEGRLRRRLMLSGEIQAEHLEGDEVAELLVVQVTGHAKLLIGDAPVLSSLAVVAQFARHLPDVALSIAFEDARLTETMSPAASPTNIADSEE